jgi:hypothetical protein
MFGFFLSFYWLGLVTPHMDLCPSLPIMSLSPVFSHTHWDYYFLVRYLFSHQLYFFIAGTVLGLFACLGITRLLAQSGFSIRYARAIGLYSYPMFFSGSIISYCWFNSSLMHSQLGFFSGLRGFGETCLQPLAEQLLYSPAHTVLVVGLYML